MRILVYVMNDWKERHQYEAPAETGAELADEFGANAEEKILTVHMEKRCP